VVQQLIADAQVLVQQAQQLEVRLDKDVIKLQVLYTHLCLTETAVPACEKLISGKATACSRDVPACGCCHLWYEGCSMRD